MLEKMLKQWHLSKKKEKKKTPESRPGYMWVQEGQIKMCQIKVNQVQCVQPWSWDHKKNFSVDETS